MLLCDLGFCAGVHMLVCVSVFVPFILFLTTLFINQSRGVTDTFFTTSLTVHLSNHDPIQAHYKKIRHN